MGLSIEWRFKFNKFVKAKWLDISTIIKSVNVSWNMGCFSISIQLTVHNGMSQLVERKHVRLYSLIRQISFIIKQFALYSAYISKKR